MFQTTNMQALVYESPSAPLSVKQLPIPPAEPGSAVVKILGALISPNMHKIFTGNWGAVPLPPAPFTLGAPAIGRIHTLGPDVTTLHPGQLVFADFHITARDSDNSVSISHGFIKQPGAATDQLAGAWKHGALAEYARVPLENVHPLDERVLFDGLGYTVPDLLQMADCFIATAALAEACELRAGDTVVVAPSTGRFSGCVVQVALAMGARVVAAGRTKAALDKLAAMFAHTDRITTAVLSGEDEKVTAALRAAAGGAGADCFVDMCPTGAEPKHIVPAIKALRYRGLAAFLGGDIGMVSLPYAHIMSQNIRVQGSCMFERKHVQQTIKLVQSGLLKLGTNLSGSFKVQAGFGLTEMEKVYAANDENLGFGNIVVVEP